MRTHNNLQIGVSRQEIVEGERWLEVRDFCVKDWETIGTE